jgi:hypothetical protein
MSYIKRQSIRFGKSALAARLIGLELPLDAMVASPASHEPIRQDADKSVNLPQI